MDQAVGRELGPYRLEAVIDTGGMGAVYRAIHPVLQQARAIKILSPRLAADPTFLERFQREAKTAAGLRHPNIVLIYDVAQQDDLHYIVMDFVEGSSLRSLIATGHPLPLERAVGLLRQLASALDYAHSQGVVHRDIKPNNVIVGPNDHLTLVDFGIARAAQETHLTRTGTVIGTPEYMAPEILAGRASGPSVDHYSLGVVAYELLTGRLPFTGTGVDVTRAHLHSPPPPPRSIRPDLPEAAEQALLRQLAKNPAERYPTATEFVAAMAAPSTEPISLPDDAPTMIIPAPVTATTPHTRPAERPPVGPPVATDSGPTTVHEPPFDASVRRSPKRLLGAGLILVILLAGGIFALNQRASPPAASGPTATVAAPAAKANTPPAATAATAQPAAATGPAPASTAGAAQSSPTAVAQTAPAPTGVSAPGPTASPSPALASTLRTVFEERFAANDRGWPDAPNGTAWFADGAYRLFGRDPGRFVAVGAPLGRSFRDVTVKGTFRKADGPPGGGYGLILRDEGPDTRDGLSQGGRYYVFEAGDKGEFGIWRRDLTRWVDLIPWTPNPTIRPDRGSNELTVQAIGPRFTFLINDTQVASIEDATLPQGGVGVYLGGDSNVVVVEHFVVQVAD